MNKLAALERGLQRGGRTQKLVSPGVDSTAMLLEPAIALAHFRGFRRRLRRGGARHLGEELVEGRPYSLRRVDAGDGHQLPHEAALRIFEGGIDCHRAPRL